MKSRALQCLCLISVSFQFLDVQILPQSRFDMDLKRFGTLGLGIRLVEVLRAPLGIPALTVLRRLCFYSMCSAPPASRLLQARMDIQPLPEFYPIIAAQFGKSCLALYNATVLYLRPSSTSDMATCKVSETQVELNHCHIALL